MIEALVPFLLAVAVFAVSGVVVGMLVARRLARMTEPDDEDAGDAVD